MLGPRPVVSLVPRRSPRPAEGKRIAKERERARRELGRRGRAAPPGRGGVRTGRAGRAASVSNEFRISLADGRRDYFKEIRNYLIRREKVINSGETN